MTSEDERVSLYYRSPQDIRDESFTHRMRGLDENEVREYLDLLADQMAAVEWQRREMLAELELLRARDEQMAANPQVVAASSVSESPPEGAQEQTAAVLRHAQEVADQLIDDARRRAQEIMAAAQTRGHEVVRQARIRTLEQMQSLYDELDGEFQRMSEPVRPSSPDQP